jgi:2-polyprenyl-3-methyl-5-hydroxy-6-metoxy-1,4-benzoquinol methylase
MARTFDRTADVAKLIGCNTRNVEYRWSIFKRHLASAAAGALALDFGAGSLRESHYLCAKGYDVTSCDLDEATLRSYFADYKWGSQTPRIVAQGALGALSGTQFALITAFDVFEHLERPEETLAKLRAMLAPGGMIFCTVPNGWTAFEIIGRVNWRLGLAIGRTFAPGAPHIQFRSPKQWQRFFEGCGFKVIDHEMSIGFFVNTWAAMVQTSTLIIRKLTRKRGDGSDADILGSVAGPRVMAALHALDQRTEAALKGLYGWNLFILGAA